MVLVAVLLSGAVFCCCVLLVLGCICHLFKRNGFTNFENDAEHGRDSMYTVNESVHGMSDITFEPLPDILAKTVGSRALRPRITCTDKEKQAAAAKLVTVYQPFPRNQLLYIKEIGLGWFGQVLQGLAENLCPDTRSTNVVVKILKDDATPAEKALFLEEVAPYRDLDHPNIIQLLGQCTEASPFLAIMEYPVVGDLKSYLLSQEKGPYIQFAMDAARGLACMHRNAYIHHDLAARNCLLMADLRLKIGDYGIGEDLYREDYYDTGCDLLPIRWMAPESLELKQGVWQPTQFTCQSNVWALSVLLWELLAAGRKPYKILRDEDVLQLVIRESKTKLPPPDSDIPLHDRWYEIMEMCWQEPSDRPTAEDILSFLQQIEEESLNQQFEQQWKKGVTSPTTVVKEEEIDSMYKPKSTPVKSKNPDQSHHHLAEVLVHRTDEYGAKAKFEDDFSKVVQIQSNRASNGFSDNFVASTDCQADASHGDSILAFGGSPGEDSIGEEYTEIFSSDANSNLLNEPVPVQMSTPNRKTANSRSDQSKDYATTLSHQIPQESKLIIATEKSSSSSEYTNNTNRACEVSSSTTTKQIKNSDCSFDQISDEGYKTDMNVTPDIVLTTSPRTEPSRKLKLNTELLSSDLDTEKAKEIYMSKGAGIPSSNVHRSRSLGTIPEDGIPSDNTSQSGLVFDDPESEDIGMNFEWDDYVGEELVGRVRYLSDESTRSPRHVEVEEWPFDQDSSSETHSKPGSIASDSDTEDDQLLQQDLNQIAERVLHKNVPDVAINNVAQDSMLPNRDGTTAEAVA